MNHYKLSNNSWDFNEINAINDIIISNKYTMGKKVFEFETKFAKKMDCAYAVMVNSGSSANLIAVASLLFSGLLNKGDTIIVPAVSWGTTYFPFQQYGFKLKFVDIDPFTLNYNISSLIQAAEDENVSAICAVNLLGNPNDFIEIQELCLLNDLILIEDNCESMGAKYKNIYTGTFGVVGTYSTYYSHHLCTMEGGMITTNFEKLYHYMLSLRSHGWTRNLPANNSLCKKKTDAFYESFNFILPGYNVRPLEIEAAVGIEQLNKLDDIVAARIKNAEYLKNRIKNIANIRTQKEIDTSSWFGFALILEIPDIRDYIIKKLNEANIETRPIVSGNFLRNSVIKYFDYSVHGKLINAEYIHDNGFLIGNHDKDITDKIESALSIIEKELTACV